MRRKRSRTRRCGARTRKGKRCKAPGYGKGGRCRNHGGMSTGPRTPEGRANIAAAVKARWERWRKDQASSQVAEPSKKEISMVVLQALRGETRPDTARARPRSHADVLSPHHRPRHGHYQDGTPVENFVPEQGCWTEW